ncbi:MAG TPA: tetratricopeptide repeat protein [Longimicrobium sp.]|jgi:tetratricopeptide (TPR) repeat protein|uniref:tetratricopeptide repeat protein n=1 Tax=Longimicrobium sp. TaxID=2029185 RepID=UPI002ED7AFD9
MRIRSTLLLAFTLASAPLAAQEPERPSLPRGADTNDWEAYFEAGEARFIQFPREATAAFYWASRLDPTRAEPIFARWASFFAVDDGTFESYLREEEFVMRRSATIANDSLLTRAYYRNPFVHRGLEVGLFVRLGRRLAWDGATNAFVNYGQGEFQRAAAQFGRLVRANPERNVRLRHYRALALVGAQEPDSAAAEIQELLQALRSRDESSVQRMYESKALWEYSLGMLYERQNRPADAAAAYERALVEDLAMYPAHAGLGRLAIAAKDTTAALSHLSQAVEAAPGDAVIHYDYGNALLQARRPEEALAAYRRALELEPYWALPYVRVGQMHDMLGRGAEALVAYREYLSRAPRNQAETITRVQQRIAALGG